MYPDHVYQHARALLATGLSINRVAALTGVPRATVGYWRRTPGVRRLPCEPLLDWRPPNDSEYAYLLGTYLGDGNLVIKGRSTSLRITLDSAYPSIVDEVASSIRATVPDVNVCRYEWPSRGNVVLLQAVTNVWRAAFPQHGPGVKHSRHIELEPWQREITHTHPRELIRGLIHSDGCRSVNRFKTKLPRGRVAQYEYVRYFFSNLSEDIKDIFCEHCDLLGVRWSRANARYVSVHDRKSVAVLDEFVGPKA